MNLSLQTQSQGQSIHWAIDSVIYQEKSWYQHIAITHSKNWGKLLLLNNRIVMAERDQITFHEHLTHIPLMVHPEPKQVLLCGAAWGGLAQEAIKHPCIKSVVQIEPDDVLVDASVRHWPHTAIATSVAKTRLLIEDINQHFDIKKHKLPKADILIIDLPSFSCALALEVLIEKLKQLLNDQGILMISAGSPYEDTTQFYHLPAHLKPFFSKVYPAAFHMPVRSGGINACFLCSDWYSPALNQSHMQRFQSLNSKLKSYDPATHSAAFVLPKLIVPKQVLPTVGHTKR